MKVSECMTGDVRLASPDDTLSQAARLMGELDAGVLPVGDQDRLVGMITDRDLAVRGLGQGKGPDAKVRDVMSAEVKYCFADDEIDDVLQNMGDLKVRRLPVVSRDKRLVGILSLGDVAMESRPAATGAALGAICTPGGSHSQTAH